ncbi:hypothetical protein [Cellulosimicrobium funkei]
MTPAAHYAFDPDTLITLLAVGFLVATAWATDRVTKRRKREGR